MKTDKVRPPTERQIRRLQELNYRGPALSTIHDAAQILNRLTVAADEATHYKRVEMEEALAASAARESELRAALEAAQALGPHFQGCHKEPHQHWSGECTCGWTEWLMEADLALTATGTTEEP